MAQHEFYPNKSQYAFLTSTAEETFFVSGIGGGKTHACAYVAYNSLLTKGAVVFVGAPTIRQLRNSTLVGMQRVWSSFNFLEGTHYVINKAPPKEWKVQKFSDLSHDKILTTRWGSYAVLDGLENYDAQRGQEFDVVIIDESRDVKNEARLMLKGRLRGIAYTKLGLPQRMYHATSPPEDPTVFIELAESNNPEIKFIFGNTYENKDNLPQSYISNLRTSYDTETFEREVMGRLLILSNNPFAYAFNEDKHVSETAAYNGENIIYLSFDFNVDPNTCIAGSVTADGVKIFKEFRLRNSNMYEMCAAIKTAFPNAVFVVTGDATGKARHVTSKLSAWDIIWENLQIERAQNFVPLSNPSVMDTRIMMNKVFIHYENILIHPECKYLIQDLKLVQVNKTGDIDKAKDKHKSHLLDCARYFIYTYLQNFRPNING